MVIKRTFKKKRFNVFNLHYGQIRFCLDENEMIMSIQTSENRKTET